MEELDTDALLNQTPRRERMQYLDNPRRASRHDFKNPFYVIVHTRQIDLEMTIGNLPEHIWLKVKGEIDIIKSTYSWTEAGQYPLATGVPSDRPILVCGAFEEVCVLEQYGRLVEAGYDAYISREGVLSRSSLK